MNMNIQQILPVAQQNNQVNRVSTSDDQKTGNAFGLNVTKREGVSLASGESKEKVGLSVKESDEGFVAYTKSFNGSAMRIDRNPEHFREKCSGKPVVATVESTLQQSVKLQKDDSPDLFQKKYSGKPVEPPVESWFETIWGYVWSAVSAPSENSETPYLDVTYPNPLS